MSRILWLGNAPWVGSGYGEQAALFVPRLARQGHDMAVLCNWGLHGRETKWDGVTCYPSDGEFGNGNLAAFVDHHRADQVIALCDAWVLKPGTWPDGLTVAVWTPVDHQPIPQVVTKVLSHPRIRPVAMSAFGFDEMQSAGLDPLYVPHGVDTRLFRPYPGLRDQVRAELDIPPDVFLVGMVAANTGTRFLSRKAFPQAFQAFKRLADWHDDAWLYVHTQPQPSTGGRGGIHLDALCEATQLPQARVRFPPEAAFHIGMPAPAVALIYQAFDVLLMPSMGEGFGIPLLEAQASGVPVIASNHSAMTENTEAGWLVEGDPWWDDHQFAWFFNPHVRSIVDALEAAYGARDNQLLRDTAVAFAQDYDADLVADTYWKPALDELLADAREGVAA